MTTLARPQHLKALDAANHIRLERAGTRRMLKAARTRQDALRAAADVVEANPDHIAGMTVFVLLSSCRGMGTFMVGRILRAVELSTTVTVGKLTDRQRSILALHLRTVHPGTSGTDGTRSAIVGALHEAGGGLDEMALVELLKIDRERVALACTALIVDGVLEQDDDGTYAVATS